MTALLRLIAIAQLAGCSLGMGSAYVGQWRPHKRVDFEACLQDEAGRCIDRKQVTTEVPGRRYWGVIVMIPGAMGGSRVTHQGMSWTMIRVEPSLEYLRGSGRFALGARLSVVTEARPGEAEVPEAEQTPSMTSIPLTLVGRVSLASRLSVHAGLGYSPYSTRGGERTAVAGRGLVGVQLALSKTHSDTFFVLTFEADRMMVQLDEPYRSTGITGNLGLFF